MADYRLYCINCDGSFTRAEWFEADNDGHAITLIRAKTLRIKCEIWEKDRLVAEIPASGAV